MKHDPTLVTFVTSSELMNKDGGDVPRYCRRKGKNRLCRLKRTSGTRHGTFGPSKMMTTRRHGNRNLARAHKEKKKKNSGNIGICRQIVLESDHYMYSYGETQ